MNNKKGMLIRTHPAILAVWAAIIAVASLLPAIPVVGTGATFNIGDSLVPLAGVFFGPWGGAVAAGIGAFIGQLIAPHTVLFGPFQFVLAMANAMCAGLIMRKKYLVPLVIILIPAAVWYAFPLGRQAWGTPPTYSIAILALLVAWIWGRDWIGSESRGKLFAGVFLASLIGIVVSWALGNLWALIMFALPPEIWYAVIAIAPIQRILFALGAAVVGTPLLIGLPKISVPVGPTLYEELEYEEEEI